MAQNRPTPIDVDRPFPVSEFFAAIGRRDKEAAFALIREFVPEDKPPSPRAQSYLDSGEWDIGKVGISKVPFGSCAGVIGTTARRDDGVVRFCGLPQNTCTFKTHLQTQWSLFTGAWYIQATGTGFLSEPSLPLFSEGGPISLDMEEALKSFNDLSIGQWKFIFNEYHAAKVLTESMEESEERAAPSVHTATSSELTFSAKVDEIMKSRSDTSDAKLPSEVDVSCAKGTHESRLY